MPTAPTEVVRPHCLSHASQLHRIRDLEATIVRHHRCHLRELTIVVVDGGVTLHGHARTFYGKQVALHEVRRRGNLTVLANHIAVR